MAAVRTALRPPPAGSGPLSWIILAAVVIGVAVGALSCAAGLAGGAGHQVHALGTDTPPALANSAHGGHAGAGPGSAAEDPSVPPVDTPSSDARHGSADPVTQGHPGMACVAMIDLHVIESVAAATAGWFHTPWTASPADCVSDLDPPVPRIS